MNDEQTTVAAANPSDLNISAGDALRQIREAAGLHIAALASMLKVPVKKLEALEQNRFDLLPDAVFVRALAASICRTLKVDPAPVLALLPMTSSSRLGFHGTGINEEFRPSGDATSRSLWVQVSRPAVVAGVVFLLGALVLVFLPAVKAAFNELKNSQFRPAAGVSKSVPTEKANELPAAVGAIDIAGVQSATSTPTVALSPTPDAGSVIAGGAPGASSPAIVTSAALPTAQDTVVFTSTGESWIEVADAKGKVVLRRLMTAGETAGVTGLLPLRVVVGRANVVQVQIRGSAFDLDPVSKDNVARFEVK